MFCKIVRANLSTEIMHIAIMLKKNIDIVIERMFIFNTYVYIIFLIMMTTLMMIISKKEDDQDSGHLLCNDGFMTQFGVSSLMHLNYFS